jgi:hypothetical protein
MRPADFVPTFCPLRRIRHPLNPQEIRIRRRHDGKNYYIRSWNVYENKGNIDIMPDLFRTFVVDRGLFLRKIAGLEGQFTAIFGFGAPLCGYLRRQARLRT